MKEPIRRLLQSDNIDFALNATDVFSSHLAFFFILSFMQLFFKDDFFFKHSMIF